MTKEPSEIEIKIIKVLSDSIPRNQNKITESIGKNKKEPKNKNMVRRALHKLESYLESPKKDRYKSGIFWTLKTDKETIKQLIVQYPSTISQLQKNDTIISEIIEKDKFGNYEKDVRDLLRLSPTFFKNYLVQEMFLEHFEKFWMKLTDVKPEIYKITNNTPPYMLFEAFRHSVINDTIENQCNEEAIEYIRKNESWFSLMKISTYFEGIIDGMNISDKDMIDENALYKEHRPINEKNKENDHLFKNIET